MSTVAKRFGSTLKDERGLVLLVVVTLAAIILISGLAFLMLTGGGSAMLIGPMNKGKALHLAEGRMRKAIWRMNQRPLAQWPTVATFSDTTADGVASAVYDSAANTLTCTGVVGRATKTISVDVNIEYELESTLNHIILYRTHFTPIGAPGILVHDPNSGPLQVNELPSLDAAHYMGIADAVYAGNKTFDNASLTGIHYVAGNVIVKNKTTLKGTLVATGNITFQGQNIIAAQAIPGDPLTYHPAVIALGSIGGGDQNLRIKGMVFADGSVDLNPCDVTGLIIAAGVTLRGSFSVIHDPKYGVPPPGFTWPPSFIMSDPSPRAMLGSWSES